MSYNGYNYSHYFNSTSQNNDRQASHPSQPSSSLNLNQSNPSYHQQQTDTRGYTASQPRQWNEPQNSSVQASSNQWYSGGSTTSAGRYQGSTTATLASAAQSQYVGGTGRPGSSQLDTSALGSLAYASGLESSGADSQGLQTNGRNSSDYSSTSRRIQTPPVRLVSPMHGSTTTALGNGNNHVRAGSTGSAQSQFVPSYRHAQQHLPTVHSHAQSVNADYNSYQPHAGGSDPNLDTQSNRGRYTNSLLNAGAKPSGFEAHGAELRTQQARLSVPEHPINSPRQSQHGYSSAPLEHQRWQTSSGYDRQMSNVQANNIQSSHHNPETTARSARLSAGRHLHLDPANANTEYKLNGAPGRVSQTDGTGQSWSSAHGQSSWDSSGTQDAQAQIERVRQHQLSRGEELRDSQLHSPQKSMHQDVQHSSMPAPSAAPITVDPSRVFNPYHQEYQRRKALADAEEARKDNQSSLSLQDIRSEQRHALTQANPQVRSSKANSGGRTATPVTSRPDTIGGNVAAHDDTDAQSAAGGLESSEKKQMESEMKLMLEKMREYKAKDPSLFLQIWEQVKKGTAQTLIKTPSLPPGALAGQASGQIQHQPSLSTDSSMAVAPTDNSQLPSPSPTITQPPVAWDSPRDSSPDLGKFPAMRRRRGAGRKSRLPQQSNTKPPLQSENLGSSNQTSQMVGYEPLSQGVVTTPSHGAETALQTGQQNELPKSSNTVLPDFHLPTATQGGKQMSKTLRGVRLPSPDRILPIEVPLDTVQMAVAKPTDVPKQSSEASLQAQRDAPARIPSDQSIHNPRVGIVWPDSKKTALATAAERALTSSAANAGKTISIEVIRSLLDYNPSYIELCESLERMGFVFDRGHFARMLLAAVPDINSSTPAQSATNATSGSPMGIKEASEHLSRAAVSVSPASIDRPMPSSTAREATLPAPRQSPQLSAESKLSTLSPHTDVGPSRRSKTLAYPPGHPSYLPKRSPGRPRKDGSPAQPRIGGQLRQRSGNRGSSLVQSHAPSAFVETASRSLPIDPALLAADRDNRQRRDAYNDSHMPDHARGASLLSNAQEQSSGYRQVTRNASNPDEDDISTAQPIRNGSAKVVGTDRNTHPASSDAVAQKAPTQRLRDNISWDPSRMWTKSLTQDSSRQGKPHDAQVPPHVTASAKLKRDNASNLNANLPHSTSHIFQKPAPSGPPSKEEMARKRSFNDIVDLTQDLSGEEEILNERLQKRPREDVFGPSNSAPEGSLFTPSWVIPPAPVNSTGPLSGTDTPETGNPLDISRFHLAKSGPLTQKNALYMDVIRPLKRRDARRRSEYNAKTIARDVLIAAGRHPDMRPLNAHLDSLRRNFYSVEFTSDLATFNWDVVDPKPADDLGADLDGMIQDADDEDDGVTAFDHQPTFESAPTQHRRAVMSSAHGGVEVFDSDIQIQGFGQGSSVKRRGPLRHSDTPHSARPAGHGHRHGGHGNETLGGSEVAAPTERSPTQLAGAVGASSSAVRVEVSGLSAVETTSNAGVQETTLSGHVASASERKRRGRPPRSTSTHSAQPSRTSSTKDDTDDNQGKKRRGRPPGSKNRTPQSSQNRAEGQFTVPSRPKSSANTTPARSALRNASTPAADQPFAVIIDTTSRNTSLRRADSQRKRKSESRDPNRRTRGRPSAASRAEPTYKIYDCQWKDCIAQLHNLDTLRKHVRKVHRAIAAFGGIPCLWKGCGKVSFLQDRKTGRHNRVHQYLDFGTEDLWDEHMDRKHLEPFAWDLGDGPSAGPSDGHDTDFSDYLSDRKGRRVTPQALSSGPQDSLILPADGKPLRAYNRTHGNMTELEKAQAIFKALEHRKKTVGPGIERGGCTLVTPARRAALRDNGFAVQVLEEEDESS